MRVEEEIREKLKEEMLKLSEVHQKYQEREIDFERADRMVNDCHVRIELLKWILEGY